jgi:CPA2 family monovalent cation:H+ antiporter-2
MVVGQSDFSSRAASEALPLRDAFAVLFFVAVGMLLDPAALAANWRVAALTLGVVLLAKPLTALVVVRLLRRPVQIGMSVGLALAQIGEFSFILAALARQLGVLPDAASQVLVVTAIVSITLNPLLFGWRDRLARWVSLLVGRRAAGAAPNVAGEAPEDRLEHRAVVIGYGPVGRTLTRLLRENGIEPTIVELNVDTVKALRGEGVRAIYGDASQESILDDAGIRAAESLLYTASGEPPDALIRQAKAANPKVFVLARAAYIGEGESLKRAGADLVVASEGEIALAMAEHLLVRLGATGEQLERERERVRTELFNVGRDSAFAGPFI